MNPAALLVHFWYRKSIAFLRAAQVPWLYSGVTKTNLYLANSAIALNCRAFEF